MISVRPINWTVDGATLVDTLGKGVVVISTSNGDRMHTLKPFRKTSRGKKYGDYMVTMTDDNSKRFTYGLDFIAKKTFGERWEEVKKKREQLAVKNSLGELF